MTIDQLLADAPKTRRRQRCMFCHDRGEYLTTSGLIACGWHLVIYYLGMHYTGA